MRHSRPIILNLKNLQKKIICFNYLETAKTEVKSSFTVEKRRMYLPNWKKIYLPDWKKKKTAISRSIKWHVRKAKIYYRKKYWKILKRNFLVSLAYKPMRSFKLIRTEVFSKNVFLRRISLADEQIHNFYRRRKWLERLREKKLNLNSDLNAGLNENLIEKNQKFQFIFIENLKYSRISFKYTGSNIFTTIGDLKGNILFAYSAGLIGKAKTRKEKTTIFISKEMGETVAMRLYKSNVAALTVSPFINHTKGRLLLKFFMSGFPLVAVFNFAKFIPKTKVTRNGVRLKKVPRK